MATRRYGAAPQSLPSSTRPGCDRQSKTLFPHTDIQEFYEVTLLNTKKSCEEKLEEVNHMADKWERTGSPTVVLQHPCPREESRDLSSSEQNGKEQAEGSTTQDGGTSGDCHVTPTQPAHFGCAASLLRYHLPQSEKCEHLYDYMDDCRKPWVQASGRKGGLNIATGDRVPVHRYHDGGEAVGGFLSLPGPGL
ncbi:hypothetical protein AAFF_G00416950 [Aldrovandia affinis]|uniref:Uncharacterized protein n=1 Tax=Aldrovandia affinis TaxID=143900 RepID=A0AAD7WJF2_9TELE|nr:hypothetical protein AAFF_G00416950 [Aldrovandia affinis]